MVRIPLIIGKLEVDIEWLLGVAVSCEEYPFLHIAEQDAYFVIVCLFELVSVSDEVYELEFTQTFGRGWVHQFDFVCPEPF